MTLLTPHKRTATKSKASIKESAAQLLPVKKKDKNKLVKA